MSLPKQLRGCSLKSGATEEQLAAVEAELGRRLPEDYRQVLRDSDGLEGFVAPETYLSLWSTSDLASLNEAYAVGEFLPGVVLLGTDGGDTGYGFTSRGRQNRYIIVPLVGMSPETAREVADSFSEFLGSLGL